MGKQVIDLQPVEDYAGADIHPAAHGGPHATARGCALKEAAAHGEPMEEEAPGRNWDLWSRALAGAGLLAGAVACGEPTLEQSVPEGLHPVEMTHAGSFSGL